MLFIRENNSDNIEVLRGICHDFVVRLIQELVVRFANPLRKSTCFEIFEEYHLKEYELEIDTYQDFVDLQQRLADPQLLMKMRFYMLEMDIPRLDEYDDFADEAELIMEWCHDNINSVDKIKTKMDLIYKSPEIRCTKDQKDIIDTAFPTGHFSSDLPGSDDGSSATEGSLESKKIQIFKQRKLYRNEKDKNINIFLEQCSENYFTAPNVLNLMESRVEFQSFIGCCMELNLIAVTTCSVERSFSLIKRASRPNRKNYSREIRVETKERLSFLNRNTSRDRFVPSVQCQQYTESEL
ncbi:hypothetical protein EIN_322890 [Entamoeba invadens IP1]|uniref:Uncharacterized protein n=1 Tax=Entamoeba invadens IP1 TaxID=370355 RepID=L7FLI7_ENTIV|nr:hypothetical protein EIN_322890 [Entamoeba invadens IP1]ELP88592.1 hypothetical protein EIN_322890 [Entamoeba invadens IP1]|eukprot:XP_004255363.1 hypothetical protein EIN_322890 [Entamoeba invadens IP1]